MSNEQRVTSNEFKNRKSDRVGAASTRRYNGSPSSVPSQAYRSLFFFTRCSLLVTRCFLLAVLFLAAGCDGRREQAITGRTMGTTYSVKVVTGYFGSIAGLQEKVDRRLDEINHSMSPYLKDSEISRFNRFRQTGQEFRIS